MSRLSFLDLYRCAQVSRTFNRFAVQAILDRHNIWSPEQSAHLRLSQTANAVDSLSALLLSVRIDKLSYVHFDLGKVTTIATAERTLVKMKQLIDRVSSVHSVRVYWPSSRVRTTKEESLTNIVQSVQSFLNSVVAKGCSKLQVEGFDAIFQAKKNSTEDRFTPSTMQPSTFIITSIFGSAKRCISGAKRFVRTAFGDAPTPSFPFPPIDSKLSRFEASSTSLFQPPFAQWTLALLKASPVKELTLSFADLPEDPQEAQSVLGLLAAGAPDVTAIYLDDARSGTMETVLNWASQFKDLDTLGAQPRCFTFDTDRVGLGLHKLIFPKLRRVECPPSFICELLAPGDASDTDPISQSGGEEGRRDIGRRLPVLSSSGVVATTYHWKSCTTLDVAAAIDTITRLESSLSSTTSNCTLHVALQFEHDLFDIAEALSCHLAPVQNTQKRIISRDDCVEGGRVFILEFILPGTRDDIREGMYDKAITSLLRLSPSVDRVILSSNELGLDLPKEVASGERVEKFRSVCTNLTSVCMY